MTMITCVEDARRIAKRRLPRPFYEFMDSGSFDQQTIRANCEDFQALKFRQRVMRDVAGRSLDTTILGQPSSMPVVISPVGMAAGLAGAGNGEIMAGRAARTAGIPFGLSMLSIAPMEEVAREIDYPFWQHIMLFKDRGLQQEIMDRAIALKAPVLIVTVDWQVQSLVRCNLKNRMGGRPTPGIALHYLAKPGYMARLARCGRKIGMGNFTEGQGVKLTPAEFAASLDQSASWDYIEWIRARWPGKLLIKGILDVEDARAAVAAGVDGLSLSNHGGAQLDGAPSPISVLPRVADAIGDDAEILLDSGVRSGQDVMKALALGARACLIGRPYLYGLAAMGQAGVEKIVSVIRNEMDITMALTGCRTVEDIGPQILEA